MNSLLLAEGVFSRALESNSLIVIIVILIVGFIFYHMTKRRNDSLVGDALRQVRGDSIQQDLFEAILVAAIVWFIYPMSPFKSPLDTTVPAATTTTAAATPAASTTTAAATPAATAATLTMKDFPLALLPVWKGDTVTFSTDKPDASLGIGQFWVVAFKPSANEAESWMKGYKTKGRAYTLPSGVTDVRIYADGTGVRTYPETITITP